MLCKTAAYRNKLIDQYWDYQQNHYPQVEKYFDGPRSAYRWPRPPVFQKNQADNNVITKPEAPEREVAKIMNLISPGERHKWFRSMSSSQALAQSLFGNLAIYDQMEWLGEITDDDGDPLFGTERLSPENFSMEYRINHLGERRSTSLDGYFSGSYQIAIECKFTEKEVGACSRPTLRRSASNYETELCDGSFTIQRARRERCSLTEIGARYWQYVPQIFNWSNDVDLNPCPLNKNYQLVRNILAINVQPNGKPTTNQGHAILIYDNRNPAFQKGGDGFTAYSEVKLALLEPKMLRKCSWQHILQEARKRNVLPWLTEQLAEKYAL